MSSIGVHVDFRPPPTKYYHALLPLEKKELVWYKDQKFTGEPVTIDFEEFGDYTVKVTFVGTWNKENETTFLFPNAVGLTFQRTSYCLPGAQEGGFFWSEYIFHHYQASPSSQPVVMRNVTPDFKPESISVSVTRR